MGRVNQWTDAGDDAEQCEAAEEHRAELDTEVTYGAGNRILLPYVQPVYFRWPARNAR